MTDIRCENCKFWDNSIASESGAEDGICRIRAPVADDRSGLGRWPFTNDSDWCGEFIIHPEVEQMQRDAVRADATPLVDDECPF